MLPSCRHALLITAAVFTLLMLAHCSKKGPRWLVYYGDKLSPHQLASVDLAILEPGHIDARQLKGVKTKLIGYVSIGEAEAYQPYWATIKEKDFVLEENPNWPQNYLVDIRAKAWQDILLNSVIPAILNKGYDGLFLDTIDTAIYLEDKDPKKYKGARKAMTAFVKRLRKKYPKIMILPNNGFALMMDLGPDIDGVVVEDLYTRYNFKTKKIGKTPPEATAYKEEILTRFKEKFKKPVYNILYAESAESELARYGISQSRKNGFNWYVTTVDLMKIGRMQD